MTSLEKAINLGYLFLTFKPKKKINTCTTFFCVYWYVSIYSEECLLPQYMYPKLSPFNGYRWCPLGKLSRMGLEQIHYNYIYVSQTDGAEWTEDQMEAGIQWGYIFNYYNIQLELKI